jgi:hypothetical protein
VSLRDKWTAARERDRLQREAWKVDQRRYAKAMALMKLGVPVTMTEGWPVPALTEEALDAMLAADNKRRAELYETFVHAGTVTTFRALGVQVLAGDDSVYSIGNHDAWAKTNGSRLLGSLAGAEAMVTDGTQAWSPGRAMFLPIGLTGLATKTKADAAIVFPDGTVHSVTLDGNLAVREAQKQVVQFNALAGVSRPTATETGSDPAVKLRKLQELRDAGLLSQEEYEAKRTDIINSI